MSQSLVEEWICFSLLTRLFNLLEVQKVIVYLLIIFESCQQNEEHVYGYMLMLKKISVYMHLVSVDVWKFDFPGDAGGVYPSAMQAFLPRLLSAAAPPGNTAQENRKQCLKAS